MERSEVFAVIESERKYQNAKDPTWNHEGKAPVGVEILLMEEYLLLARKAWSISKDDGIALDILRKVVGIGVRCFENHKVPYRYPVKSEHSE